MFLRKSLEIRCDFKPSRKFWSLFQQRTICASSKLSIPLAKIWKRYSSKELLAATPLKWQPYLRLMRIDKPIGKKFFFRIKKYKITNFGIRLCYR